RRGRVSVTWLTVKRFCASPWSAGWHDGKAFANVQLRDVAVAFTNWYHFQVFWGPLRPRNGVVAVPAWALDETYGTDSVEALENWAKSLTKTCQFTAILNNRKA